MRSPGKRVTRCWVTGAEVLLGEARLLDAELAASIRRTLAQRLSLIDRLLVDLGPRAGTTERAKALGLPAHAPRVIGAVLAEAYCAIAQSSALFVPWEEATRRQQARWVDEVKRDDRTAPIFATAQEADWARLYAVARHLRQGDQEDAVAMLRLRLDAHVARLYPGADVFGVEAWLALQDPAAMVDRAGIAEPHRTVAVELLGRRCARARRVTTAASAANPHPATPAPHVHEDPLVSPGVLPPRTTADHPGSFLPASTKDVAAPDGTAASGQDGSGGDSENAVILAVVGERR
jgi:hypothetical protein